ncbi:hypothetical protein [Pseudooctadecabacter jejudonensis]|uniref:hypothetical protein n=1 Tax=Pseudooctadecabacter jejudonensis TaxID=1391910 RepID=UPI00117BB3B4|nr:hypothetical protein [Pseudooctadecabacter jejudonensis]
MRNRVIPFALCLFMMGVSPLSAQPADFAFQGDWRGQGTAWQMGDPVRIRCPLSVEQLSSTEHLFEHRCGNALGTERFAFLLTLTPDGRAVTQEIDPSAPQAQTETLSGQWQNDFILLSGGTRQGRVVVQFDEVSADRFAFAVQRTADSGRDTLQVIYVRR